MGAQVVTTCVIYIGGNFKDRINQPGMSSKYLQNSDLSNEISLEQLAELVTKLGHPKTEGELELAMQEMVIT